MPLQNPKPRKSKPQPIVAATHMSRVSDNKLLYCVLDTKGNLWCKGYEDGDIWEAYPYDLGSKHEEYERIIGRKVPRALKNTGSNEGGEQGSLF